MRRVRTEWRAGRRRVYGAYGKLPRSQAPASVAKLVDARDSKSRSARSVGSIPTRGTSGTHCTSHEPTPAPRYPTIEDTIGAHAAGAPGAPARRRERGARQRHPRQARGQQPGRLGEGPPGDQHDPPRRGARHDQAGRHADRGDLRQHRHRAGDGGGDPRLPHAAGHAGGPERRARADDEGVRRRADPDAALGRHGVRARPREQMQKDGKGRVLDQFANADNPRIHYETTGPEIWRDTDGRVTHFVSAMGTTGTITGVSRFLKEQNPAVRIVGAQPSEGSRIPGIRKWPRGVPAEDLRPEGGRRDRPRQPGRRRGDGAPARARGGHLRRHLGGGRVLGRAADRGAGRERDHRLHRLRPRRPLPVHRRVPG